MLHNQLHGSNNGAVIKSTMMMSAHKPHPSAEPQTEAHTPGVHLVISYTINAKSSKDDEKKTTNKQKQPRAVTADVEQVGE